MAGLQTFCPLLADLKSDTLRRPSYYWNLIVRLLKKSQKHLHLAKIHHYAVFNLHITKYCTRLFIQDDYRALYTTNLIPRALRSGVGSITTTTGTVILPSHRPLDQANLQNCHIQDVKS